MKIILINLFYKEGSTGKIVELIHQFLLKQKVESHVCYAIGKHNEPGLFRFSSKISSKFYTYLSAITGKQYTYSYYETYRLIKYIKKVKPDVVNIHAININVVNVYKLLDFLKKSNIKTILTFHSEIFYTGGCSHTFDCKKYLTGCGNCPNLWEATHSIYFDNTNFFWKKLENTYKNFNNLYITCVSEWLMNRTMTSPFFKKKQIALVRNGVNTNVFKYQFDISIRNKYATIDQKIIIHVTPSFKSIIKGGEHVINLAAMLDPQKYKILIVGFDSTLKLPSNIIPLEAISDQRILAQLYSISDLTLITSKAETFSMVCVESLCCGTPVVGFKCGAPEQICLSDYSSFAEQNNIDSLYDLVVNWTSKEINKNNISKNAIQEYTDKKMTSNYFDFFSTVFSDIT